MKFSKIIILFLLFLSSLFANQHKRLAYIVSDTTIPFWQIMSKGIKEKSVEFGYEIDIYNLLQPIYSDSLPE